MKKTVSGFTIAELLVVVSIIGILTTVGFMSFSSIQANVRDAERSSRVRIISEALEKYYDKNGEYPSCAAMTQDPSVVTSVTLPSLDSAVLAAPTATNGTNSILPSCSDLTSGTDGFAYIGDGSNNCLTGTACLQYSLKYREEESGSVISITSRRTVSIAGAVAAPLAPVMTRYISGDNHVIATITPVICASGTPYYGIDSKINDGLWSGYSAWSSTIMTPPSPPIADYGVKYSYRAQARCWVNNFSYSNNTTGAEVSITKPIVNAPSVPSVVYSIPNWYSTNFYWGAVTCPSGTSARYQYDYTVKIGTSPIIDDSGWIQTTNTSVPSFTTSKIGYTYMMDAKAQCYNSYQPEGGPWSNIGHSEYTKPNPNIKVLVVAGGGAGGGRNGGGGGGGGVIYIDSKSVGNQTYSLSVGIGGTGVGLGSNGNKGGDSTFDNLTAYGGGGGGASGNAGLDGGSGGGGGGSGSDTNYGIATQPVLPSIGNGSRGGKGQNRSGGDSGGGGGGATMIGGSAYDAGGNGKMAGGNGLMNDINGVAYYGAGGGGGSCCYLGTGGSQETGGHGGSEDGSRLPASGLTNTGSGGGGSGQYQSTSGAGGSGVVIVSYDNTSMAATFTGGTSITRGSTTVVIFNSVGSGAFTVSG